MLILRVRAALAFGAGHAAWEIEQMARKVSNLSSTPDASYELRLTKCRLLSILNIDMATG